MATVYLAKDRKHDREVAIKVLLPELSASIGADRFEREIRLAAKLQHPHILSLYDSGSADGLLYYVMPFVKGESLRDRIDREGMLPIDDAIAIAIEVAGALGHAHEQGIVHRDIKPENVLLQGNHALVADFGIARAVSDASAQKLTQTGMAVGTPVYMAPEQSTGDTVGPTADLYSLGCVLYEMLAGEPPFTGKNAVQIMARHAMEGVPSVRIVRNTVPEEVEEAIFGALAKVPADRPQTAEAFVQMLGMLIGSTASMRIMRGATATRRVPSGNIRTVDGRAPESSLQDAPPAPIWKNPRVLIAAVLVLGAALGAWRWGPLRHRSVAGSGADARRIAVLYFKNASNDSSLGPLADGLTEGLIRSLATAPSLTVISQVGVEKFRGTSVTTDSVAKALRAGYVVYGDVDKDGDKIKVTVKLDDKSGANVSRTSVSGVASSITALRDSLTARASDLIRKQLGTEIAVKEEQSASGNADAWLLLQRGMKAQKDAEALNAAGDVPGRDAKFVAADSLLAASGKADSKWAEPDTRRAFLSYRRARLAGTDAAAIQKFVAEGVAQANQALELDASSADAYEARGDLIYYPYVMSLETDKAKRSARLDAARADLEKATSINRQQAGAYAMLSHLYYQLPSVTAVDIYMAAERAYDADEYLSNANVVLSRLYLAAYDMQDFDHSKHWCDVARARFPADVRAVRCQLYLLTAPGAKPNAAEAWKIADSAVAMVPPANRPRERLTEDVLVAAVLARAAANGQTALADSARHVAKRSEGSVEIDKTRDLAYTAAFAYSILGDTADAVRTLGAYLAANPDKAVALATDPYWWFKPIEKDPRYVRLVGSAH